MKSHIRLLVLYYDLGIGGVQKKIVDIVNTLGKTNTEVNSTILLKTKRLPSLQERIHNKRVCLVYYRDLVPFRVPFFFSFFVLWHVWIVRPHAILAFSDLPSFCAAWAKLLFFWRRIRVVINEDQDPVAQMKTHKFPTMRQLLVKLLYPHADTIGTVNSHFAALLQSKYNLPAQKIMLFRNWTDLKKPTASIKKQYDLIYIGRLVEEKNVIMLCEAVKNIASNSQRISLAIVGSGEYAKTLALWIQTNAMSNHVFLLGDSYHPYRLLAKAKIFVLPSFSEGVPMALLDAMAMEIPAITARYPGVYDIVREGDNAMTFQTQEELQKSIIVLLRNRALRRKITAAASKDVRKYYNRHNIDAYRRALKLQA